MRNEEEDVEFENASGIMKWIPTIMLVSVITGFIMLAYYAYHSGKESVKEEELLVIEADKTPIKEKPEDPGGMKFPNQDKTIFETFSNSPTPPKVERVLPSPEEPITQAETKETPSENAESTKAEEVTGTTNVESNTAVNEEKSESSPVEVEKVEAVGIDDKKPEMKKPAEEKTGDTKASAKPKAVEPKAAAKPPVKTGSAKIQLGAFTTEKEANETWQKIQKKFPSLSGKTPAILRADVKGKTFYRLRLGGFADKTSAAEMCKNLTAKGQSCMLAVD
jgi:cell division protein FtsN